MTSEDERQRTLPERLEIATRRALAHAGLDADLGLVVASKVPTADLQCNGIMSAARQLRRNPRQLADEVAAHLAKDVDIADVEVAGPGFINFRIRDGALAQRVDALGHDPRAGHRRTGRPQRVIVDYGGPNAAKAMHVGHLRSAVIGQCLKNLLRFQGHDVTGDIHLGDWGLQMGQLITELARTQPGLPYFVAGAAGPFPPTPPCTMEDLLRLYPQAAARSKAEPAVREAGRIATAELQTGRPGYRALWQHFADVSIAEIRRDYGRMGIEFEQWFGESRYQQRLGELTRRLVGQGVAVESDGALVIRVAKDDGDQTPPLILQNSDEGFGYGATDLATIEERTGAFAADTILYVVDARQSLHFEQVFRAARKSVVGNKPVGLEHLAFGTVNGPDGKPFKTREGGVMRLADLMQMLVAEAHRRIREAGLDTDLDAAEAEKVAEIVGVGALKFADLQHDRESDYIFDVARFCKFEGRTGPYIQYTGVRIKSLLARAADAGLAPGPVRIEQPIERDLALVLDRFHLAVERSIELRKPHILAEHLYALASLYNQFYHGSRVLLEADKARAASWLTLSRIALTQLELGMSLLGIEVPEKM